MSRKMLIDATHAEETRVAVVDGNRLVDYDYESQVRKQLKGSIFLAKVTRVEPSLQAAFVNFGGNRHGFLPFSEIHPDYYRIPIADREALIAEQRAELDARLREEEAEEDEDEDEDEEASLDEDEDEIEEIGGEVPADDDNKGNRKDAAENDSNADELSDQGDEDAGNGGSGHRGRNRRGRGRGRGGRGRQPARGRRVEIVGGDDPESDRPLRPMNRRNYKIQEVVKRGQIMLIQVSKEERGNKGAAVTTYLSLPGRYGVLMPNSPRGGGVSRKIASVAERRRMRDLLTELKVPEGMSVIMRTAGVGRTKTEIKRDLDYLMRLWDDIRETTLKSSAPALVHEEGNLIRRAIRDIYAKEIDEVMVAGDDGYKFARDFMKMMIPSHVRRVKQYKDEKIPLFHRYQVESQINEMGEPSVTLRSGGYLVINPTEALVSIDVNSGRATKERHIEETALKTNLEAADEVARQLRLRDLGGLVVIDFIDMEDRRNNRKVEQRLKEALSNDRARIQIGRISSFGLLELSRQRLNPSLTEAQYERCPHCAGVGHIRTIDSAAITVMRALTEEGIRERASQVTLHLPNAVAIYIFNHKRDMLDDIERRYGFQIMVRVDESLAPAGYKIEPSKGVVLQEQAEEETQQNDNSQQNQPDASDSSPEDEERGGRSRRRRGRRGGRRRRGEGRGDDQQQQSDENVRAAGDRVDASQDNNFAAPEVADAETQKSDESAPPKRGRGRRTSKKDVAPEAESVTQPEDQPAMATETQAGEVTVSAEAETGSADKAKTRKRASSKAASPKKPAAKAKDTPENVKADSKPEADARPPAEEAKAPSNDVAPVAKEYETVNEAPARKKKGWWNRLVE